MTNIEKSQIETMRNDGRTITDIALKLGIPESTVKSYCYRKKQKQLGPKEPTRSRIYAKSYLDCPPKQSGNGSMDELRLLSAKETAKVLGVNANTVYRLWARGLLDYWRINMTMKTNMKAVGEFLERVKNKELGRL